MQPRMSKNPLAVRRRPAWAVLAALACAGLAPAAAPPVPRPSAKQLEKLVADLGADEFATRERAQRALLAVGAEAVPALRSAVDDPDPEVRRRATEIASAAEKRAAAIFQALGADVLWRTRGHVDAISFFGRDASRLKTAHLRELIGFAWLHQVNLAATPIGDDDLVPLGRLHALTYLSLENTKVTDAGLAHLAGLVKLEYLSLDRTRVAGRSLVHLAGMRRLKTLELARSRVTDSGLAVGIRGLEGLTRLEDLTLDGTRITDDGLACLKVVKTPLYLQLSDTRISDAGLVHLEAVPNLVSLGLNDTAVTDAGCRTLRSIKTLEVILLDRTRVTVAGLRLLRNMPRLRAVNIRDTPVTKAQARELMRVMPRRVDVLGNYFTVGGQSAD